MFGKSLIDLIARVEELERIVNATPPEPPLPDYPPPAQEEDAPAKGKGKGKSKDDA